MLGHDLRAVIKIRTYIGGMVMTNGYLIGAGEDCVLIDAPMGITEWLEEQGEMPKELLLTHQHYDHVEDVAKLIAKGVRIRAYTEYSPEITLENFKAQWGLPIEIETYQVDDLLKEKNTITSGAYTFRLEYVPGHSTDSIIFIIEPSASTDQDQQTYVFAGDTLFADGIGRPDLPGGDEILLLEGIRNKLLTLPDDTRVFPGHGLETNVGREKASNPYL